MLAVMKQFGTFFSFSNHERLPIVVHLAVHLETGQRVYFKTQNVLQRTIQPPSTTLSNFFLCLRMIIFPEHCYTQKCQNVILQINPQKKFNDRNKKSQFQVVPMYIPPMQLAEFIQSIQTMTSVFICDCY